MKRLVFVLAAVIAAAASFAGDPSSASNPEIVKVMTPPEGPPPPVVGDPVGFIDGTVYETVEDLRVSCPDIDLVFSRSYGSWSTRSSSFGYGWTHSYEWWLSSSDGKVMVYAAGESGPSDAVHTFEMPNPGELVVNSDGYTLLWSSEGAYSLVTPDAMTYAFNEARRLSSISTWNGTTVTLERDGPTGAVVRATHSCGKSLCFEYDDNGFLVRVTTPDENVYAEITVGEFDGVRVLERVVRRDGGVASTNGYSYCETPEPGTRDPQSAISPLKVVMDYDFSAPPIMYGTAPREDYEKYNVIYNEISKMLFGSTAPSVRPLLSSKTDANGRVAQYEYTRPSDEPNARCSHMEFDGGIFSTSLSFGNGVTEELKPTAWGEAKTTVNYDGSRRETGRATGAESRSRTYDGNGDMVCERISNAATAAFVEKRSAYDARHRVVSSGAGYRAAPARFTRLSWDDRRNIPNRTVSPEGRVSEWTTNGLDVAVYGAGTNDARLVTRIFMTPDEHPQTIVSPDGVATAFSYCEAGYVTNIVADGLPPMSLGYDSLGRVNEIALSGPDGTARTTALVNNWRGRPLSVAYPDGTSESFAYDGNGRRVTRHVDALGREDVYRWVFGLPVHAGRIIGGTTNTLFGVEHDKQLNVISITDPLGRKAETYVLDENERVVAVTNLEGQAMTRAYAVGKMISAETRFDGTEVAYGCDADGNLSEVQYPDGTLAFRYDGDGLLTSASNVVGIASNAYDSATGWLDEARGADGTTVSYTHRNGGAVSSVSSVAGTVAYSFDESGRWAGISSAAGTFGFSYCEWNGQLASATNGHGLATEYAYDTMDRVTNISWRTVGGEPLGGFAYGYDAIGRIVSRNHTLGDTSQPSQISQQEQKTYSYDDLDRLASDGDIEYVYDAAGNRLAKTGGGETVAYTLGVGDRLASWSVGSYEYDAAGSVTRIVRAGKPTLDLAWNGQYQLVSVATNGAFAEGYAYDALGRRVSTTTIEGTMRHVYDSNWQCMADIDEQDNVVASYVWGDGIDKLLAVKLGNATYYPLTDIQGTVWGYVDAENSVVARWRYDAWGNVVDEDVAVPVLASLRYRFQGREWSAATGLINFRMRWYDAETGRWLSKDPIGLSGGLNLYEFCCSDSVNRNDIVGDNPAVAIYVGGAIIADMIEAAVEVVAMAMVANEIVSACKNQTLDNRPNVKKQGRELKNKSRSKANWKDRKSPRRDRRHPKHTPGKAHRKYGKPSAADGIGGVSINKPSDDEDNGETEDENGCDNQ